MTRRAAIVLSILFSSWINTSHAFLIQDILAANGDLLGHIEFSQGLCLSPCIPGPSGGQIGGIGPPGGQNKNIGPPGRQIIHIGPPGRQIADIGPPGGKIVDLSFMVPGGVSIWEETDHIVRANWSIDDSTWQLKDLFVKVRDTAGTTETRDVLYLSTSEYSTDSEGSGNISFEPRDWVPTPATLALTDSEGSGDVRFEASNSVPTPATLALFGIGLAGLGWSRRKKA